ncbi:MAG: hypothetical protein RLZZ234_153 [Candidatus Parcubacteria bacterium]|jgi:hypothetical protein
MVQKWNLGDIVPPERSRRHAARPALERTEPSSPPLRDMRRRVDEVKVGSTSPRRTHPESPHYLRTPPTEKNPDHHYEAPVVDDEMDDDIRDIKIKVGRTTRLRRAFAVVSIIVVAVVVGAIATITMTGADVTVKPKWKDVAVSAIIDAKKNGGARDMSYEVLSLSEEGERKISATGQEKVSTKATGEITVVNAQSTAKQRLIKNTRFESQNGKIYRITDSIEIPGTTKSASGEVIPGTIQAKVIADGPGESYNIPPGKFTIPGLKGSEQYEKVYAESKSPMAGGYEGMKFIIDEGVLSKARQELHLELREKLLARLKSERPNGFVFFEPSVTFSYVSLPPTDAGNQAVIMKEQAKLSLPLFKTDSFATFIADKTIAGYGGEPMRIEDVSKLSFSYPATSTDVSMSESLKFRLEGSVRMIWKYDMEKLRASLKGLEESMLPTVLSEYSAIDRSRVIIRPFWKDSFPENLEKIRIVEVMEMSE